MYVTPLVEVALINTKGVLCGSTPPTPAPPAPRPRGGKLW